MRLIGPRAEALLPAGHSYFMVDASSSPVSSLGQGPGSLRFPLLVFQRSPRSPWAGS